MGHMLHLFKVWAFLDFKNKTECICQKKEESCNIFLTLVKEYHESQVSLSGATASFTNIYQTDTHTLTAPDTHGHSGTTPKNRIGNYLTNNNSMLEIQRN